MSSGQCPRGLCDSLDARTFGDHRAQRRDEFLSAAGILEVDGEGRHVHLHSMRKTFASRMVKEGMRLVDLQRLMGHKNPATTTAYYVEVEAQQLRDAVDRTRAIEAGDPAGYGVRVGSNSVAPADAVASLNKAARLTPPNDQTWAGARGRTRTGDHCFTKGERVAG